MTYTTETPSHPTVTSPAGSPGASAAVATREVARRFVDEGAEHVVGEFRAGFSDLHAEITAEIAQDEFVALTLVLRGTHDGELSGIPATGARIELPIAIVTRIEDGQIVEDWEYYDLATIMSQLGLDTGEV